MIKNFKCRETEKIFSGQYSQRLPSNIQQKILDKLIMLDSAEIIEDLTIPPGNRLEKLKGLRDECYSIRVNNQWRICFKWAEGNAYLVEVVDYH